MEISLNWIAICVVTLGFWIGGALWFGPIFGKIWMRIHHGEKKFTDEEMKNAAAGMWKLLVAELISNFVMVATLAFLIAVLPSYSGMYLGFLVWIGFVLPTIVSSTIWGNDSKKWMTPKILISASYRLIALVAAGYVLGIW